MAGLVVVGNRWVVSGRHSSEATALAADVIEEIEGLGFRETWTGFGCASAPAFCDVAPAAAGLAAWRDRASMRLPDGRVTLRIDALGAASLDAARGLRVGVTVSWADGSRERDVRLVRIRS